MLVECSGILEGTWLKQVPEKPQSSSTSTGHCPLHVHEHVHEGVHEPGTH